MRLLILASAATLVVTGAAMARESVHHHVMHHHYHHESAPIAEGSADTLSAHDAHMKNLHDSGYNPHNDLDAYGNVQTAQ
jgi:hypothetical protein